VRLIGIQCQTPLQDLFREKSLPDLYAAVDSYPNLRDLGMKMTTPMNRHKHIREFIENVGANICNYKESGPRTKKGWAPLHTIFLSS
jgi:hypothetical protein